MADFTKYKDVDDVVTSVDGKEGLNVSQVSLKQARFDLASVNVVNHLRANSFSVDNLIDNFDEDDWYLTQLAPWGVHTDKSKTTDGIEVKSSWWFKDSNGYIDFGCDSESRDEDNNVTTPYRSSFVSFKPKDESVDLEMYSYKTPDPNIDGDLGEEYTNRVILRSEPLYDDTPYERKSFALSVTYDGVLKVEEV